MNTNNTHSLVDLVDSHCEINHGRWDDNRLCQAVNYLTIPIGMQVNEVEAIAVRQLQIPICSDCAETLSSRDPNWNLFLCLGCGYAEWHLKEISRYYSDETIIMVKSCKYCKLEEHG